MICLRMLAACLSCALSAAVGFAQAAPKGAAVSARAVLERGSEAVKGLPNFGRNALPGIYGEYRLERKSAAESPIGPRVLVWMTDEALFVSAADWSPARLAGRAAFVSTNVRLSDGIRYRYELFDRPFSAAGQGAEPSRWSVIVALPEAAEEAAVEYGRFLPLFLDRLSFFLSNARRPTDASFPAVLEW